jgi:hypothetical protein
MKEKILLHIDDPIQLEKLYRNNKTAFKTEFNLIYPELIDNKLAGYWRARLNYESPEIFWGSNKELTFVIIASLIAGVIAKIPFIFNINPELFYQRNVGFIVFPVLTAYLIWKKSLSIKKMIFSGIAFLIGLIFINLLPPANDKSDTLILSCIHLIFFMWAILGIIYVGNIMDYQKRLEFLRYNGDLAIMTGLLGIAGVILTGITIGLFSVIGLNIEEIYFNNVAVFGFAAIPLIATYITETNPQLVNKVSPVLAKIFSPLVLIMLVVYLVAIIFSGKNPYNDRDFLIVFNILLIGVMAIILFSIAEKAKNEENRTYNYILLALSIVTGIVNGIALSAILFRISEWGITPNRLAILGSNILMLINLSMVTFRLFKNIFKKTNMSEVGNSISIFLPVYFVWIIVVTFIFPLLFNFK